MLAIASFITSFVVARTFTTLSPHVVVTTGGIHIHHFWYGLALLAIGGWLGISYSGDRIDRIAAVLFGAGGGIVGDEVGLLLTFGDYWTEITYTFLIVFLAVVFTIFLLKRYSKTIHTELIEFARTNSSLYVGVFLVAVSIAFITMTNNIIIIAISTAVAVAACTMVSTYFIQLIKARNGKKTN